MKKVLFAAVAVLAFGVSNAQEIKFGAKAGLNMSNFTGDAETDAKIGFFVGGFAEIGISDKFAVQPELLFSVLGAKDDVANYDSNYLLLPVMAKYYATEKLSLEAGPQVGFLMSAKYDGEDIKDFYKSTDFALNLGAGYDVTENINVGLRYSLGLSNVSDVDGADVKTSNISLGVGYKF
jgi:opacity protein-like surface antigen